VAQTAYALSGEREKALAEGCDDYFAKPIDQTMLTEVLLKYFREKTV
jgi:two-component system, NarL family, sensor histidine kinase BarA